jgi:CheY-like chemotaxis protein
MSKRKTILLADNDSMALSERKAFLERAGYLVLPASSPNETRRIAERGAIDLIVTDLRLSNDEDEKDISGLLLARDLDPHIPKIILTKFPTFGAVRSALSSAFDGLPIAVDFVDKREGLEALLKAIDKAFEIYVGINFALEVEFAEGLTTNELVTSLLHSQFVNQPSVSTADLTDELDDLFRKLFSKDSKIVIHRAPEASEKSPLLRVLRTTADGDQQEVFVRIGGRYQAQLEWVDDQAELARATSVSQFWHARTQRFGAIGYARRLDALKILLWDSARQGWANAARAIQAGDRELLEHNIHALTVSLCERLGCKLLQPSRQDAGYRISNMDTSAIFINSQLSDGLLLIFHHEPTVELSHLKALLYLINRFTGPQMRVALLFFFGQADSAEAWYGALGQRILSELRFRPGNRQPRALAGGESWEDFLTDVAKMASAKRRKVVIVLDEIGAMPPDWSTDFFTTIRSVHGSRQSQPFYQHLTFIIAGAFDPISLIKDRNVSGFNIDHRIPLDDFDQAQTRQLANHLDAASDVIAAAAERVFYWADGQPFLSQWLFFHLANQARSATPSELSEAVDVRVEQFLRQDGRSHLRRINELRTSPELLDSLKRLSTEQMHPYVSDNHFRLASVLGIIKANSRRRGQIRNRIYERALAESGILSLPGATHSSRGKFQYDAFISYSSKDIAWVREKLLPSLEQKKLRICIDFRSFKIGMTKLENMVEAVKQSRKTVLIMTPNWVDSEWTAFESILNQDSDPIGRRRRTLPVLAEKCLPPARLAIFTYADLTDPDTFDSEMQRLIDAISSDDE